MRKITLLVVDDHPQVREALVSRLRAIPDFIVIGHTGNPTAAREMAWFWEPDVILIDVKRMGGQVGEACRRISLASPRSKLIVLTSYIDRQERESCQQAGVAACLLKSIGLKALLEEVRSLVNVPA